MSRQMAFQMTGFQFVEYAKKLAALPKFQGSKTLGAWIDEHVQDPRERERLAAVFIIISKCQKENLDFTKIRKMIVWRDAQGKAKDIETEFMPDAGIKLPAEQPLSQHKGPSDPAKENEGL